MVRKGPRGASGLPYVCMSGLYRYIQTDIIACAHLGNGTGHRNATMAAPLLLTSGPARYEAERHNNICVCVCTKGGMEGPVWNEPENVILCYMWQDKPGMCRGCMQW